MVKLERNKTEQTQRIYWSIFNHLLIYSTRRNLKNYQNNGNGIMRKPDKKSTQGIKHKGLCNNIERKRSSQPVAG